MPTASAVPPNPQVRDARAIRWMRFAAALLIALVALTCGVLLAIRFVVFPRIDDWRDDIARRLAQQLDQDVEIDRLSTGWDGWNPKLIVSGLRIRDRGDAQSLLELPHVELLVAWTSLPYGDLVLRELVIERPLLAISRDAEGRIRVAGVDVGARRGDGRVTAWLLRQSSIVVRDALITWDDEQRKAPQLVLDRVQFRLEQTLGVHRFGLTGTPPAEVASPFDLRGEWSGPALQDWRQVAGRLYARVDYADVGPLREWLPLPSELQSGKGALRVWFDFDSGVARGAVADVELAEVSVRLGAKLPPLELRHLAGHLEWKEQGARRSLAARGLGFVAQGGTALAPTDATASVERDGEGRINAGQLDIGTLDLVPLAALASHFPLPDAWRDNLAQLAPRGVLRNVRYTWQGPLEAPQRFSAGAAFTDLAVAALGAMPGVSAVSGSFETTESKGTIRLTERAASLTLPRVFDEAVAFDRLRASAHWERRAEGIGVRIEELAFANAHAAGSLTGSWQSAASGPGSVELNGRIARADVAQVWRYVPVAGVRLRDWMQRALVKGTATEGRFTLTGSLAQSPFAPGTTAHLAVAAKVQDGTLEYAQQWPAATGVEGDLRIDGRRLSFVARGQVLGVNVTRASIEIPEIRAPGGAELRLDLEAGGPTTHFLDFIAQSPVTGYIGGASENMQATGDGTLALRLDLGLARQKPPSVQGEYTFVNNQLRGPGLPAPLAAVNGKVAFSERGLQAQDVAAEIFGGPAKIGIAKVDERTRVTVSGSANLALLRSQTPFPLAERLGGTTDWQLIVTLLPKFAVWQLESSLKGATIDLPAPIGKTAADALPLRVERRMRGNQTDRDILSVELRNVARLVAQRRVAGPETTLERALLLLGKATERPGDADRPGIWVRADVPSISIDEWLAVAARERTRGSGGGPPAPAAPAPAAPAAPAPSASPGLEGVEIVAGTLDAAGRRFRDARVTARASAEEWRMTINTNELAGTAVWRGAAASLPNGRVMARLSRLTVPKASELSTPSASPKATGTGTEAEAANWPELDITADTLVASGRDLGRLEMTARPAGPDWRIEQLAITNEHGRIAVDGLWRPGAAAEKTKLDVKVDTKDTGPFLARFGYADAVTGAPTTIEGQLAWNGAPSSIDFPTLGGNFRIASGAGQFTKIDPGIGKLLGILSLQMLPRRITLDFRDVFSEGFAFDEIVGGVRINLGIMHSDDLKINGPAARVEISGDVNLAQETQQITVKVIPSIGSVSAGTAALLLAANPLIAAAVGAGALVAHTMGVNSPLDQAFSYEYKITGGWSEPIVTRVQATPIALPGDGTGR